MHVRKPTADAGFQPVGPQVVEICYDFLVKSTFSTSRLGLAMSYQTILDDLRAKRRSQKEAIARYEEARSWAMAYLVLWVTLEDAIKKVHGIRVKEELLPQINAWKHYLEEKRTTVPNKIHNTDFSIKPSQIPTPKQIKEALGDCRVVKKVLGSKGKWRTRRNDIAHDAKEFARESTYRRYKEDVESALYELERALEEKLK